MENLTKQQIILLTLLVSFVTSIATGIVTVSLMNQAPIGITQTINRVVERTIETVTPPTKEIQTVVKETVVVNPEDQIVTAVEKTSKSVVKIYRTNTDPSADSNSMIFVGLGAIVTNDGVIATDNVLISEGGKYFITTASDKLFSASILKSGSEKQIALLKIESDSKTPITFNNLSLSKVDLKLGQTVIYIGAEKKDLVSTGIVSSLSVKEIKTSEQSTSTATRISSIETSISSNFIPGGLLLNLSGELVGIKSTYLDTAKTGYFAPSSDIQNELSVVLEPAKKAQ